MSKPVCTKSREGFAYRASDGAVTCCLCDYEMEWQECSDCGGDCGFDGYEEDPNWYQPGETIPCNQCGGKGGDWWCINGSCMTNTALVILEEKPQP